MKENKVTNVIRISREKWLFKDLKIKTIPMMIRLAAKIKNVLIRCENPILSSLW